MSSYRRVAASGYQAANNPLPEKLQGPWRARLRRLRESHEVYRSDVRTFGPGTLGHYENHDLTSMKLGQMVSYAEELGMDPREFLLYLVGDERSEAVNPMPRRVSRYFNLLTPANQQLCIELIRAMVEYQDRQHRTRRAADRSSGRGVRALLAEVAGD